MKRMFKIFIACFICCSSMAFSQGTSIRVDDAYVRGLPPSVENTSVYMTIFNDSEAPVTLVGAKTSIANSVMLHRTEEDAGMMNMQHMLSWTILPEDKLVLESGAKHLMIMGLLEPLNFDGQVELTLIFDNGFEYIINVPVISVLDE